MTDKEVLPSDAEKLYGALTVPFLDKAESFEQREIEDPTPLTPQELQEMGLQWGDYLEECLEYLVETYDGVEKIGDGYAITKLEQEKHLERSEND